MSDTVCGDARDRKQGRAAGIVRRDPGTTSSRPTQHNEVISMNNTPCRIVEGGASER
ncbi:hypothetical protein YM304_05850 [Ilumatobacter coccineus YM16-304]|uniref:Uncharacterized protein n=1 Tax=Ilumatobacter coccineus (strain NBRC 103263 / KCTC 29153 / YM16-304) TaxID=1313172 RepID=A0A6C7E6M7_ILUCY|nr:hypothetical protein YM304_05850 [Ilumatobacter coccineus YM16-304]